MPARRSSTKGTARHSEKIERRGTPARTEPMTSMAQGEVACPTKAQPRRKTCGTGTRSMYRIAAAKPERKAGFSARFSGSLPASR